MMYGPHRQTLNLINRYQGLGFPSPALNHGKSRGTNIRALGIGIMPLQSSDLNLKAEGLKKVQACLPLPVHS